MELSYVNLGVLKKKELCQLLKISLCQLNNAVWKCKCKYKTTKHWYKKFLQKKLNYNISVKSITLLAETIFIKSNTNDDLNNNLIILQLIIQDIKKIKNECIKYNFLETLNTVKDDFSKFTFVKKHIETKLVNLRLQLKNQIKKSIYRFEEITNEEHLMRQLTHISYHLWSEGDDVTKYSAMKKLYPVLRQRFMNLDQHEQNIYKLEKQVNIEYLYDDTNREAAGPLGATILKHTLIRECDNTCLPMTTYDASSLRNVLQKITECSKCCKVHFS